MTFTPHSRNNGQPRQPNTAAIEAAHAAAASAFHAKIKDPARKTAAAHFKAAIATQQDTLRAHRVSIAHRTFSKPTVAPTLAERKTWSRLPRG